MSRETSKSRSEFIRSNRQQLYDLPEPGDEWRPQEVPKWIADRVHSLEKRGIIDRVRGEPYESNGKERGVYETTEVGYEILLRFVAPREDAFLPCGHDPVRNDSDVEGVVCLICGEEHTREEVLGE